MDCDVRLEAEGEVGVIAGVVEAAFGGERVPRLLEELRNSTAWRGLSYVATVDGNLAAHVAFTRGWIDAQARLVEVLILSPMSVVPDYQRQGIGSRLIRDALTSLHQRDDPLVFLEGDPRFYSRFGFRPGGEAGFLRPSVRIPEVAFQYFPLPGYDPSITGQLVYPDAFWNHDCVGLRPVL